MRSLHARSDVTRPHERPDRRPSQTQRSAIPLDFKGIGALALRDAGVRRCDRRGRVTPTGRYVRVPARFPSGEEHRAQLYGPDGRPCGWTPGESLIPFGLDLLPRGFGAMLSAAAITEGASDMLALREWACEWDGLPLFVIGLPGASTWRREWAAIVEPFSRVYCIADADPAGRRMADAVLRDLPRARRVVLPDGADVRGLIQTGRGDELAAAIGQADLDALLFDAFHQPTFAMARAQLGQALRNGYRPAAVRYAA